MPAEGPPPKLTAEQFRAWKESKDAGKKQVVCNGRPRLRVWQRKGAGEGLHSSRECWQHWGCSPPSGVRPASGWLSQRLAVRASMQRCRLGRAVLHKGPTCDGRLSTRARCRRQRRRPPGGTRTSWRIGYRWSSSQARALSMTGCAVPSRRCTHSRRSPPSNSPGNHLTPRHSCCIACTTCTAGRELHTYHPELFEGH